MHCMNVLVVRNSGGRGVAFFLSLSGFVFLLRDLLTCCTDADY